MKKLYKIDYIIQHMYLFKQILPPKNFQELLEDFVFLHNNKYLFDREKEILLDCVAGLYEFEDDDLLSDGCVFYQKPNFTFPNYCDTQTFDGAYDSFKKLNRLLNNNQVAESFNFFDCL